MQYEIQRIILKVGKKRRKNTQKIHTRTKHLNYKPAKALHQKALGGVFVFSFTFSIHISHCHILFITGVREELLITQSVAQGSLQNSQTPAELMPHKLHVGSIILVDKSVFMSVCQILEQ